jgi:hypothetical protein
MTRTTLRRGGAGQRDPAEEDAAAVAGLLGDYGGGPEDWDPAGLARAILHHRDTVGTVVVPPPPTPPHPLRRRRGTPSVTRSPV